LEKLKVTNFVQSPFTDPKLKMQITTESRAGEYTQLYQTEFFNAAISALCLVPSMFQEGLKLYHLKALGVDVAGI